MKKCDIAVADYQMVIKESPEFEPAYMGSANCKLSLGDIDGAIADFSALIRVSPKNVAAYTNRGSAYVRAGQVDKAIADLEQAKRLDPSQAQWIDMMIKGIEVQRGG